MSLDELINRIEKNEWQEGDYEHPLARAVLEELAQGEENPLQKKLFNDAMILADPIIEKYLTLDREDKLKMAEVYSGEESFNQIGGLHSGTQEKLKNKLEHNIYNILCQISNYSKLITIVENYIKYIENDSSISLPTSSLGYYLSNYDRKNRKIDGKRKNSIENIRKFDFKSNRLNKSGSEDSIFKSITYGLPDGLVQRLIEVQSLSPIRKKIVKQYLEYVNNIKDSELRHTSLCYYLTHYSLDGRKVSKRNSRSMNRFYMVDFINRKKLQSKDMSLFISSLTQGMPDDTKSKIKEVQNRLERRKKIIANYLTYIEENKDVTLNNSNLIRYLNSHNLEGMRVKRQSKESLHSYVLYDFERLCMHKKYKPEKVIESLTFGMDNQLKKKVIGAQTLLYARQKILKNYVHYISHSKEIITRTSRLVHFLRNYDINGKKVRNSSSKSLVAYYCYDFRKGRQFKRWDEKEVLGSLCVGVPEELKQEVEKAQTLLPVRINILNNYINYIENNQDIRVNQASLSYYCRTHNLVGEEVKGYQQGSLYHFACFNFKNNCKLKPINPKKIFESLTYGVPKDLKQKVEDATSLLKMRTKILNNYVEYVEKNRPDNPGLNNYLLNHSIEGKEVKSNSEDSLVRFSLYDFRKSHGFKKRTLETIFLSLAYNIKGPVVDKAKSYTFFEHSVSELIDKIEKNEWRKNDYKHPLSRSVLEELTLCENEGNRKKIFSHLRCRNNSIITKYISLDEISKQKIVNNYLELKKQEKVSPDEIMRLISKQIHYYYQRYVLGGNKNGKNKLNR